MSVDKHANHLLAAAGITISSQALREGDWENGGVFKGARRIEERLPVERR